MTNGLAEALARRRRPTREAAPDLAQILGVGDISHASLDQRTVARALSLALLEQWSPAMRALITDNGTRLHDNLLQLTNAMWPEDESDPDAYENLRTQLVNTSDPVARAIAAAYLAQIGHMHQLAGLLVRDHTLQQALKDNAPSTATSFLDGKIGKNKEGKRYEDVNEAVAALNRPALEMTFTAHPTNTNGLSSMQAQRVLGQALMAWRKEPTAANAKNVQEALADYAHEPLLSLRQSPQKDDPGAQMPGFTPQVETEHMLYALHNAYDDMGDVYDSYDRALAAKFGDDYDPTQLKLNLKFHSWGSSGDKDGNSNINADTTLHAVANHYEQMLDRYLSDLPAIPALDTWRARMTEARRAAFGVRVGCEQFAEKNESMNEPFFDKRRDWLKESVQDLDAARFEKDLEEAYRTASAEDKPQLLALMRRVHSFGFTLGSIEYRETADVYHEIVAAMIDGYGAMSEPERIIAIDGILQDPAKREAMASKLRSISEGGAGKPYGESIAPIAYATRKRMELARDFPALFQNQVLAECEHTSNMLEALLLQHATADAQGTRATLGIVPLFEKAETFRRAPDILVASLNAPSYRAHVDAVAAAQHIAPSQQMQSAHSDNVRRNGLLAGRELIMTNIERVREAFQQFNANAEARGQAPVTLQQYYGGSQSDAYRGGVRAISATINEFKVHDFAKIMFQGGDLLNYLNQPYSFFRIVMRNLTHNAARLEQPARPVIPAYAAENAAASRALAATREEYEKLFNSDEFNDFLLSIGFNEEARYGNAGSRSGARGFVALDRPSQARTITFSEVLQHAGMNPSWLGARDLPNLLSEQVIGAKNPAVLKKLYKESDIYKDVIDRMLYGLARTDMEYLDERSGHHPMMGRLREEYAAAFKLCMESFTGQSLSRLTQGRELEDMSTAEQRALLIDKVFKLPAKAFHDQSRYIDLLRDVKRNWNPAEDDSGQLGMLLHNGMDTVFHGRVPLLDDPTYATYYERATNQEREFGPGK